MTVGKPRLLVVEDQADLRLLLELHLRAAGYEVESSADGISGLERARSHPPDAIIVDLAIPGIDGAELSRSVRADPALPVMPILIYSGFPETDLRVVAALELPRVSYEPKGTLRRLTGALEQLLDPRKDPQPALS